MRRSLPGVLSVRAAAAMFLRHTRPAASALAAAARDPEAAQVGVLARLTAVASRTEYGRAHGIDGALDHAAWERRVPVVTWAELAPWLAAERARAGALVSEPVVRWVRSRAPDGSVREIPSTQGLRAAFERAFFVEAHDLLSTRLAVRTGFAYVHVDPPGARVDDTDASDYASGPAGAIARRFLVVDPRLRRVRSSEAFQDALAISLLAAEDLELVSIWSPTDLLALCDYILAHRDRLAAVLAAKRLVVEALELRLRPLSAARRAALDAGDLRALWPELKLISMWTTHDAEGPAAEVATRLPQACIHGKGIIATAGPLTLGVSYADGYVPTLDQLYIELEGEDGRVRPLHEATVGDEYALVISQPAGLLRLRLGDRVRVTHRWQRVPCLRYAGRW